MVAWPTVPASKAGNVRGTMIAIRPNTPYLESLVSF